MKKSIKTLFILTCSAVLFAGCAKDDLVAQKGDGEMTQVTFTAAIPTDMATKAVADNDGNAASVNRCIMEIYYGEDLFTRMYSTVNDKKASFTTNLVANRTYTVAFWADCVTDNTTDAAIATDLYYTTTSLKAVSIKGDYVGNDDARDAFFHCGSYTVKQNGSTWSDIKLYRPFAQVNVITTDLQVIKPVTELTPSGINVTVKNAYTTFNVVSGEVGGATNLNYAAALYKFPEAINEQTDATLSMDYLFAASEKAVIDIDWKATKANNADVSHAFTNIPYQRNYRTNIKGALLTASGQWNVTVDPAWTNAGTGEFEVVVLVANTVEDAQTLINSHAGTNSVTQTVEIQVKEEISDVKELYIPDNTTTPNWVFKIEDMTENGQIVVKDEHPTDGSVNYKKSAEVALPSGTTASQTTFNTPNAHGVVSGTFGRIDATTSATTLEVKVDATVSEIYVHQGNVALYGTVGSIKRGENNTADVIVNVYDGAVWTNWDSEKNSEGINPIVNLGTYTFNPTGYNVEGSTVFANIGSSPATWTVSVTDEWQYYAAKEFSNVSGTTITIMNAAELALFAKNVNADVNYTGYTIQLGADIDLYAHEWTPIMLDEGCATNLTFDGNGRTISGLRINNRMESYSALFGTYFSHGSVIKDLVLNSPIVDQDQDPDKTAQEVGLNYTAALVAHMGCGVIDNCSVIDGTINGQDQVGAIVGYVACGDVKNCTVESCLVNADVCRAGGLVGKVNTDSEYEISNNTVSRTSVTAKEKCDGMLSAAALVGQIMTGSGDKWYIKDNTIENVMTETNEDKTFVPVGEFRKDHFKADAYTGGHIVNNTWDEDCADTDRYIMVNPANTSESVTIWNGTPVVWTAYAAASFSQIDESAKTITITSAAELALYAIKAGSYGKDWTISLSADIDLAAHIWDPISMANATFDGANHTVSNVTAYGKKKVGFFGGVSCGTVKNLTIDSATIEGINHVAAVSGYAICATFTNCHVKNATITSNVENNDDGDKAGAICGYLTAEQKASITGCSATNCTITAYRDLGSIVGYAGHDDNGIPVVENNTASNVVINCDTRNNYNKYDTDAEFDAGEIIGDKQPHLQESCNTATDVTINYIR